VDFEARCAGLAEPVADGFCATRDRLIKKTDQIATSSFAGRHRCRIKRCIPFVDCARERASYYKVRFRFAAPARGLLPNVTPDFDTPYPAFEYQEKQFAQAFAILREAVGRRAFPGAALAITHQGELVASMGFGRFTYDEDSPEIRPDTIYDLASLTKVLATTAMAMILFEGGRLSLDEPLAETLPEFVTLVPKHQQELRRSVTIRMLLAHASGLPAYEKLFEFVGNREELIRAALTTPLKAAPGTRAEYSDIGFILLGEAVERKAGIALDVFARREIFSPLSMRQTYFNPPPALKLTIPPTENDHRFRSRVIQGEVNDENAYLMGGVAGHAGVFATAGDVARFAECMLRGGAPILHPETIKLFTRRDVLPARTSRALGWDTPSRPESSSGRFFSSLAFGHLGFTGSSLWIDPGRKLSVTLLTNRTWPHRESQLIREFRPQIHDAIVEALEGRHHLPT
jgi:serine-type D-Ala-D-Ala carboxypeptidase